VSGDSAQITGIGLVTPVGSDVDGFFEALCKGPSGLRKPPEGHPAGPDLQVAGLAPEIDPVSVLPPTETRCVDRFVLLALLAADRAMADAGIEVGRDVDPVRIAVILGTGGGGLQTFELSNMATARIAIKYGIRGFSSAIVIACAAGAQAIAEAYRLIADGSADVVVCGGTESPLHPTIAAAFGNARALARGWDDPTAASRPFDTRGNGFVLGEGAAITIVERAAHADARRASSYASLIGWGATSDAHHPTMPRPDGDGAAEAVASALAIARGVLPPTHNLDDPDPECDLDHVLGTGRTGQVSTAVSNSFAFGGHNVSLIVGPADTARRREA
jgi:3-oxoacyl-[acyl-carrier-protein] synthase II